MSVSTVRPWSSIRTAYGIDTRRRPMWRRYYAVMSSRDSRSNGCVSTLIRRPCTDDGGPMIELFRRLFGSGSSDLRRRTVAIYSVLVVANIAAWLWAIALFREQPILLGTALIAFTALAWPTRSVP